MNDRNPMNRTPRKPAPARGRVSSPESRFIGYVVLGFGILAVVAVVIIATSRSSTDGTEGTSQTLVRELVDTPTAAPPKPRKELYFPRDANVDPKAMLGNWQSTIGKYTAVLQFQEGVYQVILAQPDPNAARLYSSGTYKNLEDIFVLTPRVDWPPPAVPKDSKIAYDILTHAPFPIIARFEKDKMIWQNPPQSEGRVLIPYKLPLLVNEDAHYVVWSRLE